MIAGQRRNVILETVRADGAATIADLAMLVGASAVTIRRDLDYLDSIGSLTRTHGGALVGQPSRESSYVEKAGQVMAEKTAIARSAAALVHDGDVIIVGPGTTTEALAIELLGRSGLTVITNSLLVADSFANSPSNEVIVTGGTLRASIRALVGESTTRTLRGIHADVAFLSCNGADAEFGLSTPNLTVAEADRAMAGAARAVVALVDHTKFGERAAHQTVPTERITHVVTDAATPRSALQGFVDHGVSVHIASKGSGLLDTV